jgi:hypothetical protein
VPRISAEPVSHDALVRLGSFPSIKKDCATCKTFGGMAGNLKSVRAVIIALAR